MTIFYYFQDASLLYVVTPYSNITFNWSSSFKEIIGGLFEFRLDVLHLLGSLCMLPEIMDPVTKVLFKLLFLPLLWFILLFLSVGPCLKYKKPRMEDGKYENETSGRTVKSTHPKSNIDHIEGEKEDETRLQNKKMKTE